MEKITILMKKRLLVFLFLSTIGWMILFGRVVYIQVILGEELQQKAYEQQTRDRLITPKRGSILDRNGVGLAVTETVNSVSVIPVQIKEKEQTAKYLADILELKYDTVLEKIKQNGIDEEIFTRTKKKIYGRYVTDYNSVADEGRMFLSDYFKGINSFDYLEEYNQVTKEFAEQILKDIFNEEKMVISIVETK